MKDNLALLMLLSVGLSLKPLVPAEAAENMNFRGTLIEPPACVINNDQVIEVDFGDQLGVHSIDGQRYRQTVNYQLHCEADAQSRGVVLRVSGTATAFDNAAVQTDRADLGVRLLLDGQPLPLNTDLSLDPQQPPRLEAVPVQRSASPILAEGTFAATATLQADYP
ncbi:fimbrial protein [Pseudomonas protegens]|uniref:fimbrial protein n=1 Tax=Pseudomonas protegens TaxID=380021 RepID=UPI000F4A53D0|nr:fimbrial protein [Pseudomonas protegens]